MIGAINFNDNVNANDNLYIKHVVCSKFQVSNFKFQDFFYDRRHEQR